MHKYKERSVPVMLGSAAGHGVPEKEYDCCCAVFMPASPPLHRLQRGGNAPLIYHSSVLTIWSRSDDPHLALPACLFSPSLPTPLLWVCISLLLFSCSVSVSLSSPFVSVWAHHSIYSVSFFVSLSLLERSDFVFASLLLTLTSTWFCQI